jgi:hypothetical protein
MGMDSKKKVQDVKLTDNIFRENPYGTKYGQEIVSVQESFEARLWKEGRPSTSWGNAIAVTAGTQSTVTSMDASPACELYPIRICLSANVDCEFQIQYVSKMVDIGNSGTLYEVFFLKAGTPVVIKLSGETKVPEYGTVKVVAKPVTTGIAYASIYGIEVTSNA